MEKKQYYSIREAAQRYSVNESTLRYWEKEFDELAPRRNGKGTRFYSEKDLQLVQWIHYLLKEKGMTLEGVRNVLANKNAIADRAEMLSRLKQVRAELVSIAEAFDNCAQGNGS
ncbi:MAG: MerR family transcriptional regulator [Tannerella sp.]|jgi:DNA-binding transcriptional MerR regulator|nr:MerR family transcriptional regulator [Tannerella sp.]